MENNNFFI